MDERDNKIADLQRQIQLMRDGNDIELIENIRRRAIQDIISAGIVSGATDIDQAVNEAGSATYNVADAPDSKVRVTIDGTSYYIPLYNV